METHPYSQAEAIVHAWKCAIVVEVLTQTQKAKVEIKLSLLPPKYGESLS